MVSGVSIVDRIRLGRAEGARERRDEAVGMCGVEGVRFVSNGGDMNKSLNATVLPGRVEPRAMDEAVVLGRSGVDLRLE